MKNVEFANEFVKELYQKIINDHRGLSGIILLLLQKSRPIIIKDITNTEKGVEIIINQEDDIIKIDLDFLKKKIYLKKPENIYKEIYDNYPRKFITPCGYLYENNERSITKKLLFKEDFEKEKVYHYELNENSNHYSIIIKAKQAIFDEEKVILELLYRKNKYNNIRDLLMAILEYVDIRKFDISLGDAKGSNVTIQNGKIDRYIEYYEDEEQYKKIYLENDEFYIEKKVKEPYHDNLTSYVKKLGEKYGKEKR